MKGMINFVREYADILGTVKLFEHIDGKSLESMLSCLGAKTVLFKKDEFILLQGSKPKHIGVVLDGSVQIIKEDMDGERILLTVLGGGGFFAEALCCAGVEKSPVSVVASSNSVVMLLEFGKILHTCPSSCAFHTKLIENMLYVIAQKNLMLQGRMEFIGKKTMRMKILSYLKSCAASREYGNITIPFNREELADFLCVDRSALSHELSRMKKDGILDYYKNHFRLK